MHKKGIKQSKQVLYVVSTYYHTLIAAVKQLSQKLCADILCTEYIPEREKLIKGLKRSGLFNHVIYIEGVCEYKASNILDFVMSFHRKNIAQIEKSFPERFCFERYTEINIFHDDTWMAHYLKSKRIPYRLIEDSLDSYTYISKTKFAYLLPQKDIKWFVKRLFHIGYLFLGADGLAYEIEVNAKAGVEFHSKKLVEVPRRPLFESLNEEQIILLKKIFLKKDYSITLEDGAIVFTQPLWTDRFAKSEQEQIAIYEYLIDRDLPDQKLAIKPHPRDYIKYEKFFPYAMVLNKNMPAEMLRYISPVNFSDFVVFSPDNKLKEKLNPLPKLGGYIKIAKRCG